MSKKCCPRDCPYLIKAVSACFNPNLSERSIKLKRHYLFKYQKICDKPLQTDAEFRKRKLEKVMKKH